MIELPVELTHFLAACFAVYGWMVYPAGALMMLTFLVASVWITALAVFVRRF